MVKYAGFWYRVLAYIIDGVVSLILLSIIAFSLILLLSAVLANRATVADVESAGTALGSVLPFFVSWLYFTIFESSNWSSTPGKRFLGLRVTDEAGNRIGFGKANARYWSKIISGLTLLLGYFMIAFTEKKQGLHDKIAGTLVIRV